MADALLRGKARALPLCTGPGRMQARRVTDLSRLRPGRYGIPEPGPDCPELAPETLDLILVPGLAVAPPAKQEAAVGEAPDEAPAVREVYYEKVEANAKGIFRYEMSVSPDGMLKVTLDDTKEDRHPTIPPKQLNEQAQAELNDILSLKSLREIDREYVGIEPDPPALTSWRLKVVYTTAARSVGATSTVVSWSAR